MTQTTPTPPDSAMLDRYFAGESTAFEAAQVRSFFAGSARWQRASETMSTLNFSDAERDGVTTEAALERLRTRLRCTEQAEWAEGDSRNDRGDRDQPRRTLPTLPVTWAALAIATMVLAFSVVVGREQIVQWIRGFIVSPSQRMDLEYVVHKGEHATIQLADGSRVILGPDSRLRYPSHFAGASRIVELEGAAFFDVSHDPAHPFTVVAGGAVVQELGTAFSATAYLGDSTVNVVVTEGRVALRARGAQSESGTALTRGDMASFNRTGLTTVTHNTDLNATLAWTRGVLLFDDMPMRDVARVLGRWYDADFVFASAAVANRKITLSAGPESLNEVLMQLSTVLGVHISRNGRIVTVAE